MYNIEALHQMYISSHTFLRSLVESYLFSLPLRKEMIRCLRFAETVITQCIESACVGKNSHNKMYHAEQPVDLINSYSK